MRKCILSALLATGLCLGAHAAEVVVKVRPPALKVEKRTARPGPNHVWVGGYHRWDGNSYVWEPGKWEVPPREHAAWVSPRWEHHHDGYVFVEGRWK
jgi:WXXGXW repeat (2 copies)